MCAAACRSLINATPLVALTAVSSSLIRTILMGICCPQRTPLGMQQARRAHSPPWLRRLPRRLRSRTNSSARSQRLRRSWRVATRRAASRARCAPAGIPYTLLYPSTDTCPVTPDNKGMTGRGIPCVAPACAVPPACACLSSTGRPALIAWRLPCQCARLRNVCTAQDDLKCMSCSMGAALTCGPPLLQVQRFHLRTFS